jgi:hypothetical protein
MSELGELIAVPVGHDDPDEDCPFCPPPDVKGYTTFPGSANNSGKLEDIMEDPGCLLEKQSGARPQTSRKDKDGWQQEQRKPRARKKDNSKKYTFQAHHLISGKQALEGQSMEDWILASDRNELATGYSINSTGNGFWAPSVPKKFVGKWGPGKGLSNDERQTHAEKVMQDFGAQIHIGPHNISDPDDPRGKVHKSYDKYIKGKLKEIDRRIVAWKKECFTCKPKKKKKQATHHVHDVLDNLSTHLQTKISGGRRNWEIYLSKYALDYHAPGGKCVHTAQKKI